MSDQSNDKRAQSGTAADRKPSATNATAYGALLGLVTGGADWLILNCYAGGHWHYVPPSPQLIEVAAPMVFLPCALWLVQVFSTIGDIILKKLQRNDQ